MITCKFEDGGAASLRHVTCNCILIKGNQIALIKRAHDVPVEPGKWALPGGFMDRDEDLYDCVRRETLEETGLKIIDPELFLIVHMPIRQNEDRQNIDFIFIASAGEKVGDSDHEIDQVKWFNIPNIPKPEEMAFDHGLIIDRYFQHLKKPSTLPILDFNY